MAAIKHGRMMEKKSHHVESSSSAYSRVRAWIQKELTEALQNYVHGEMEHSSATR